MFTNIALTFVSVVIVIVLIAHAIKKNKNEVVDASIDVDDKTYTSIKYSESVKVTTVEGLDINKADMSLSYTKTTYNGNVKTPTPTVTFDGKVLERKIVETKNNRLPNKDLRLVFVKADGKYSGTDIIRYPFKIIHHELGIKKCRFYDLRGSYATQVLRNGAEIRDVADILGHSKVETTENYYISSTEESRKEVNDILEKIIQTDVINEIMNYNF